MVNALTQDIKNMIDKFVCTLIENDIQHTQIEDILYVIGMLDVEPIDRLSLLLSRMDDLQIIDIKFK
jgi:hypothetical protein